MHSFRMTKISCYTGYVVQAIVNCLPPLLYSAFHSSLGISLAQIGLLITVNFCVQLAVDLSSAVMTDRIGYRRSVVAAHLFAAAGMASMSFLPFLLPSAFTGLLFATVLAAVGGGLIEVVVSPIIEAIPGERKAMGMAFLHSFYCWGHVLLVLLTTLLFFLFGAEFFRWIPLIWASVPLANTLLIARVPIRELKDEPGEKMPLRTLLVRPVFLLLCVLMLSAGASELAMSQWASFFAENALGVTKSLGDLAGPCLFAALMGIGRVLYGLFGAKLDLRICLALTSVFSIGCYLLAALAQNPYLSLLGCALCGLSVAVMWPGVYSLGAQLCPGGGTAMFAVFAFFGDFGCTAGPLLVSLIAGNRGFSGGILISALFPGLMLIASLLLRISTGRKKD